MSIPIHLAALERGFTEADIAPGAPATILRGFEAHPATVIAVARDMSAEIVTITVREERRRKHLAIIDPMAATVEFTRRSNGAFYPRGLGVGCRVGLALGIRESTA